ncbi:unnamed protein product, partial [Urochloa humidicola]
TITTSRDTPTGTHTRGGADELCSRKMAAAAEGLAAYRAVLRAARRTFAGDQLMLKESAVEIRRRFEDHRGLAPGSDEAARALADAREAAHFITHMIVQATRGASGSFVVKPESVHAGATLELPSEEILSKLK